MANNNKSFPAAIGHKKLWFAFLAIPLLLGRLKLAELEVHCQSPRQQHTKSQQKENGSRLGQSHILLNNLPQQNTNNEQPCENKNKYLGAFQINLTVSHLHLGGPDQRIREYKSSDQESTHSPGQRNSGHWRCKHKKPRTHSQRRDEQFLRIDCFIGCAHPEQHGHTGCHSCTYRNGNLRIYEMHGFHHPMKCVSFYFKQSNSFLIYYSENSKAL